LGKFGALINILAILWGVLAIIFSAFPIYEPVTAINMNYSIVVFGGWIGGGVIYYLVRQRKSYNGPVVLYME